MINRHPHMITEARSTRNDKIERGRMINRMISEHEKLSFPVNNLEYAILLAERYCILFGYFDVIKVALSCLYISYSTSQNKYGDMYYPETCGDILRNVNLKRNIPSLFDMGNSLDASVEQNLHLSYLCKKQVFNSLHTMYCSTDIFYACYFLIKGQRHQNDDGKITENISRHIISSTGNTIRISNSQYIDLSKYFIAFEEKYPATTIKTGVLGRHILRTPFTQSNMARNAISHQIRTGNSKIIGTGAHGIVYFVTDHDNDCKAIKVFHGKYNSRNSSNEKKEKVTDEFISELYCLQNIESEHVISVISYSENILCLEYCEISLDRVISLNVVDDEHKTEILHDVIKGIEAIHNASIVHCDIKPENVMMRNGKARIIDFGLSLFIPGNEERKLIKQSPPYRAPEVIKDRIVTKGIDIWGYGCIYYELTRGRSLLKSQTEIEQLKEIYCTINAEVESFDEILLGSLAIESKDRYSANQIKCLIENPTP